MKKIAFLSLLFTLFLRTYGQIDMNDSTAQVVGYWDKNEKQTYSVSHEKYKVNGNDTTSRELTRYTVVISITDSTEDSYIINWFYHDFEIISDIELIKKLSSIVEDMNVVIKTDELGVFKEVLNWQDIRDYITKATNALKAELKDIPNIDQVISQIQNLYSTKESIEATAINEIQQFYTFHGGKYKMGEEINTSIKLPNIYGGEPFDTDLIIWLDELNPDDNNFVMRMQQTVNWEQLTKSTFDYLTKVSETMKVQAPVWEEFPPIQNNTWTASRIHTSGWVLYSIETREVSSEGTLSVEENIMELQ